MRRPIAPFISGGMILVGLSLWFIATKYEKRSPRGYWQSIFTGNTSFLFGLYCLVSSGWIPGGKSVPDWLLIGVGASSLPTWYVNFLNWRDRKAQKDKQKAQDEPEPLRVPN